jgi:macrolide phosphotransferase
MARTHLTLAALATTAIPGLDVVSAARFGAHGGDFDSALLTGRDGRHWIIRTPRTQAAESAQSADLVALRALSAGVRTRLPFAVSSFAGQAPLGRTRAVVYEFVYGSRLPIDGYALETSASVGRAIAAIHALPTSFVADAGLPVLGAADCQRAAQSVVDRSAATGLVPVGLLDRWQQAMQDPRLWQFQPTVINGALDADSLLFADGAVTGLLGWQELRVGDPAQDLRWLVASPVEAVVEGAFAAYRAVRGGSDLQVQSRAMLYAELDVAKWLLHGTEVRSTEIVDDAVAMLTELSDRMRTDVMNPLSPATMPTATVDEVEALLERSERLA